MLINTACTVQEYGIHAGEDTVFDVAAPPPGSKYAQQQSFSPLVHPRIVSAGGWATEVT